MGLGLWGVWGGVLWALGLYDAHGLVHPAPCPPPGAVNPGLLLSEEAPRFSAPRCVLFCQVLAVSLLAFEAEVPGRISAPVAHRLSIGNAGRARRGRDGGLFAVSTLAWEVEADVEVFDSFSASIETRFCDDQSPRRRGAAMTEVW